MTLAACSATDWLAIIMTGGTCPHLHSARSGGAASDYPGQMSLGFPGMGRATGSIADRFLLFVEQLEQAILLLESGRIARQRMALVALDNLAEGLIFHHLQKVFLASDEPTWVKHREFPAKERR